MDEPCPECGGSGEKVYASTSTFMGGIGGSAMTTDWCDKCWGTGLKHRKDPDLREMGIRNGKVIREYKKRAKATGNIAGYKRFVDYVVNERGLVSVRKAAKIIDCNLDDICEGI